MAPYPTECNQMLKGHKGPVNDACYNKSGQYCLSAGHDRTVRLWNPATGMHLHTYTGHGREVLGVAVASDNAKIASCGVDRAVMLWDVGSGEILRRYTAHWEKVNTVDFNEEATVLASDGLDDAKRLRKSYTSSADGKLRTFDLRMGQMLEDYIGPAITSARISKDSNCILVSTLDNTIRLMDKANGTLLNEFKGHRHTEYKIESTLTNTDAHAISGSEDGKIYIWDVLEDTPVTTLESHEGVVTSVDYHPSDVAMLSAGGDGCIRIWS
ncbi:WD repeat-containing protein 83 [Apophysomyces sp. BC1034]|nr:WD repeat-containing protein 83 [Apophysomyces sp. BC1015]KAG0183545.1 WD repeat-containing protein 83 [Apophysomyces sp. BC1021]KAG0194005.1 WD repeat-containing protein 83 [Apophysomyces sp. BC1034]